MRIARAGVYLKPALVQVAHAAVKDTNHPYYKLKYERIAKRRGKKRAIIAIARMILTAIYSMFCTGGSVESSGSLQSRYARTFEGTATCESH